MKKSPANIAILCILLLCGCATKNVNPPTARPQTGYVDFYADDISPLCWHIEQTDPKGNAKTIFEQFAPMTERIVRLAFVPGSYQLHVAFLNRAIVEPGSVELLVEDSEITPVRVTLVETGKTMLETRRERVGSTFYGRTGRSTRIGAAESGLFRIDVEAQAPLPYRTKVHMPYANAEQETNQ